MLQIFWIILAFVAAAIIALFQYGYLKPKKNETKKPWFALLRFLTVFTVLLLLINPKFNRTTYETLKPQVLVMVDDSKSIGYLGMDKNIQTDLDNILNDSDLKDQYDLKPYVFSDQLRPYEKTYFKGLETDISQAISQPQELFKDRNKAIVILTDGNQSRGNNVAFTPVDAKTVVYPIIYGDTTQYPDIRITQLNANKYSYLNNEFPVEIFINYTGNETVTKKLRINQNGGSVFQQQITVSPSNRVAVVTAMINSKAVGTMTLSATIETLIAEKNKVNNTRNFAVEVIDQQTKILILTNASHPDVAALKKAITSNQQRKVEIASTREDNNLNDYSMVIMYGVNNAFAKAYSQIKQFNKNTWVIAGPNTDFNFINNTTRSYSISNDAERDVVQPLLNKSYNAFNIEPFSFDDYPPVKAPFGKLEASAALDVLMFRQIGAVETAQPLWFSYEEDGSKHAVLLADGFWRWRAQSYLDSQSFSNFDELVNSQIQYLSSNKRRERLELDYEPFYYQNQKIAITARYLDKNYEFEDKGVISLNLKNKETGKSFVRPFVLSGNSYVVDLSGTDAGTYSFTARVENESLSKSGSFTILEYDIEKQFSSADASSLKTLVGEKQLFYRGQLDNLKMALKNNPLLKPVERATVQYSSLIDWQVLLGLLIFLLALEWFARKYNGLI